MDIQFTNHPPGDYDWALNGTGTDLGAENGLFTAITLSLFTDRLANADDIIPDGSGDRRGSWLDIPLDGDSTRGPPDLMGSRLWLLENAKATPETKTRAIGYIKEALQWMIDDGVAAAVAVTADWVSNTGLGREALAIAIVITHQDSTTGPASTRFDAVWEASTGLRLVPA